MPAPDLVLVPRWAVQALVGPATIQEQSQARRELGNALKTDQDTKEA